MTPAAVRTRIRTGELPASRVGRRHRILWTDVLACEAGSGSPDDPRERTGLLTVGAFARAVGVSGRTVHRWIAAGLPTRRIGVNVRLHPIDAGDWMVARHAATSGVALRDLTGAWIEVTGGPLKGTERRTFRNGLAALGELERIGWLQPGDAPGLADICSAAVIRQVYNAALERALAAGLIGIL